MGPALHREADVAESDPTRDDGDFEALRRQGRARVAAVLAILAVLAALVWWFNRAPDRGPVVDCGDLDAAAAPALEHDRYCSLRGTVDGQVVLTMGRENEQAMDEATRKKGLRYFVKLPGNVVAALPGGRPDLEAFKREREHLQGFVVDGVGRIFDAAQEKGYGGTAAALRRAFALPEGQTLWIFDAADRPDP